MRFELLVCLLYEWNEKGLLPTLPKMVKRAGYGSGYERSELDDYYNDRSGGI